MTNKTLPMHRSKPAPRAAALILGLVLATGSGTPANAKPTYTTIDPPGSTNTQPYCINANGDIAGNYYDKKNISHGFLRSHVDGSITVFDPPGSFNTQVGDSVCINSQGVIVGYFADAENLFHGYIRSADGRMGRSRRISLVRDAAGTLFGVTAKGKDLARAGPAASL